MSAEFPRRQLSSLAMWFIDDKRYAEAIVLCESMQRYDELALRVCEDNTKSSLHIAELRERIRILEQKP